MADLSREKWPKLAGLFCLVALTLAPPFITAEEALEEVVVYGELLGFGEARANNSVDAAAIRQYAPTNDVLNYINRLPGVNITQGDSIGGNDWSTRIYIRGMSTTREASQIGYMIDNVPNGGASYLGGAKPNRFIDSENVARIKVAQNSADISTASNEALGGTVRYYSSMPTPEQTMTLSYTGGDFGLQRLFGRLNSGPFWGDASAYVSVSKSSIDAWIGEGNGEFDHLHIDSLLAKPFANGLNMVARLSYNERRENDYNSVSLASFARDKDSDGLNDNWTGDPDIDTDYRRGWGGDRDDALAYVEFDYDFKQGQRLRLTPYYHYQRGWGWWVPPYVVTTQAASPTAARGPRAFHDNTFARDSDGLLLPSDADVSAYPCLAGRYDDDLPGYELQAGFSCESAGRAATRRRSGYWNDRFGLTAEYALDIGQFNSVTAGLWWQEQDRDNDRKWFNLSDENTGLAFDDDAYWVDFDRNYQTTTRKIYVEDELSLLSGGLVLSLGLAYHEVDTDYLSRLEGDDVYRSSRIRRSQEQSETLPKLSLLYQFTQTTEVFASYAKNVRFIPEDALSAGSTAGLEPEISDNWDLGVRWAGGGAALVAQLFIQDFDDRLGAAVPEGDSMFDENQANLINIGGVESRGGELALAWDINSHFSSYFSYSYIDSEYSQSSPADGIVKGNALVMTPENQAYVELLWRAEHLGNQLQIALDHKYVDQRYGTFDNTDRLESYGLTGLRIKYSITPGNWLQRLDLLAVASNLFDEQYLSASDGDQGGSYFLGAPRSLSFSIQAEF